MKPKHKLDNCSQCGKEYERYVANISNVCKKCRQDYYNQKYRERYRLPEVDRKHKYPLGVNEQRRRYTRLRNELDKIKDREEWIQYLKNELDNMMANGIWDWCSEKSSPDHLEKRNFDENGNPKIGRIPNKQTQYEDTRGLQID